MKSIKNLLFTIFIWLCGCQFVNAASIGVTTNKTTVVVGSTVKVTVTVKGTGTEKGKVGAWTYCVNYDSSVLTLTDSTASGGGKCVNDGVVNLIGATTTFTFKAKASGSANVSIYDAALYDFETEAPMSVSAGSVTIKAKTQAEIEASYSTNANLKSLSVDGYDITPKFDKDTLKYSLEVENEVEKITIKAGRADNSARVSGTGEKELTEGINKFEIVVTAEKGNKKTYVIEVNRKELNPIHVNVDGNDYTVVRKADVMEAPTYYSSTEIEIQDEVVPAYKSDITGYVLVGLKDEEGNISLYRYDLDTLEYELYIQLSTESITLIPLNPEKALEGYDLTKKIVINDKDVNCYVGDSESEFVLIYGKNASNGEIGWYKYDTKENTFQRYEVLVESVEKEEFDLYFVLTIVFIILSFVSILLVIVLLGMNSKLRKKNNKLISMVEASRVSQLAAKKEVKEEKVEVKEETKEVDLSTVEEEGISRREQRRLEKQKEIEQQEEMRKMQEDFLKTEANEIIVDDVELEESTPVKKAKRGRKKK